MMDWKKFNENIERAERRPSVEHRILDAMDRAEKRGRRVVQVIMHPNAYRAWRATEIPGGDGGSLEWAGILFKKDSRLRGGRLRVRTA